jgi:diguanylate cyclase (GGDEF)-like protein
MVGTAIVVRLLSERIQRLLAELDAAARTDRLTGLPNRRAFEEEFEREAARSGRTGRPFALVLADVDCFKELNDTAGHMAGDAALADLGRLLRRELRDIDLPARVGGDEFALLVPETGTDGARQLGSRLARLVRERAAEAESPIGLSFGVAVHGPDGRTLDELMRTADDALYASKRRSRSRIVASV